MKSISTPVNFFGGVALFDVEFHWTHEWDESPLGVLAIRAGNSRLVPGVPLRYLKVEFPSEFVNSATNSLAQFFVNRLPKDHRIEHVYWFCEEDVLKVWIVIPEPDFALEGPIYEVQMFFMEKFPEYECDFSMIYRFGKSLKDIEPQGAQRVL